MKNLFDYDLLIRKNFGLYFSLIAVIVLFLIMEVTYQMLFEQTIMVVSHLFYFPIIICSFFLPKRGVLISTFIAMIYLILINYMIPGVYGIVPSTMQFYVYISIAVTVSLISDRIQQERRKFSSIFNYSESGICLFNRKTGDIIDKNSKYEKIAREWDIPENLKEIAETCIKNNGESPLDLLEKQGSIQNCEIEITGSDGIEHNALITASMIPKDYVVITLNDITEIKSYQKEIHKLNGELSIANEKANMYLDILIHDINNANTASLGYAELMKDAIPESDEIYFDKMMTGIKHSSNIISNVARIREVHSSDFVVGPVNLDKIIKSAMDEHPELKVEYDGKDIEVIGGPLLKDVFSIILENSRNYGGKGVEVKIKVRETTEDIYIEICDDGPGVTDSKKETLFRRFQPEGDGRRGRGLGLSVCWYILNKFGGDISAFDREEGDFKSGLMVIVKLKKYCRPE